MDRRSPSRALAPGKLILMGEHGAVYGCPAVVSAIGLHVEAEARSGNRGVRVELNDLSSVVESSWDELKQHAQEARAQWELYAAEPDSGAFSPARQHGRTELVRVALGELALRAARPFSALDLRVVSQIPLGSGFGSSAAVGAAVMTAVSHWVGNSCEGEELAALVQEVERRQHGLPSGIDHQTVIRGGTLVARRGTDGDLELRTLRGDCGFLAGMAIYQTGTPAETTGEVVAGVRRLRKRCPAEFEQILMEMHEVVELFVAEFDSSRPISSRIVPLISRFETALERMGVVPAEVRDTIRQVERMGGAAKISGAGALSGNGAGCLVAFWPNRAIGEPMPELPGCRSLEAPFGVAGARIEAAE